MSSGADLTGLSVLVVEDEALLRKQLTAELERLGADVTGAGTVAAGRQRAAEAGFDYVLLDVSLPDGLGTDLLKEKVFPAHAGVIVMTAHGGVEGAVEAMRKGALDYLSKPIEPGELPLIIARARRATQLARLDEHRRRDPQQTAAAFFFGSSLAGLEQQLEKILAADRRMQANLPPVLIQGETGTGKTTIARWLHHRGPRASHPLVEMNCSAVPETLAETELFGHERGAFTDAHAARMGLFEAAHGGTLFLDELPSLSLGLQAKLLKVLEDHRVRRVGGTRELAVDVRVIAATHRDLKELVSTGGFREDLYHRLDLYRVQLPALRERGEDILHLVDLLVRQLCQRHRLPCKRVTELGRRRLLSHAWPGNVRELSHELERAIVFEDSEELSFDHLQVPLEATPSSAANPWLNPSFCFPERGFVLEEATGLLIQRALEQTGGNVSAAARMLGVTRDFLRYRLTASKPGHPSPPPGGVE